MSQDSSVAEMLKPDNSNVKRGFVLVGLAVLLGLFMSMQVLNGPDQANEIIAAPTVSIEDDTASSVTVEVAETTRVTRQVSPITAASNTSVDDSETSVEEETTTTSTTASTASTTTARASAVVQVLNGARFSGVASAASNVLEDDGFELVTPGDTPEVYNNSTVLYSEGFASQAQAIAAALNIDSDALQILTSQNQPIDDVADVDIVVVVGKDETIPR